MHKGPLVEKKTMHKYLMAERKALGLKQKDVADAISMNESTYGRKERGDSQFELSEAIAIARYMNKTLEELFPEFFLSA